MSSEHERVFVVWGGNQSLAKAVGEKVGMGRFLPIVGGGQVTDMYLGSQILTQIRQCTQAIILVQAPPDGDNHINLNDNMMFEWGYITCRMPPNKIHVFLLDMKINNLPSDLMGTWATEIIQQGRDISEVSEEIARIFHANASNPIEMNKMEILHSWDNTKRLITQYNEITNCSDVEMAHIILHSIESCYQYMDDEYAEEILNIIKPISSVLEYVIKMFKVNIRLVRETKHLTMPIDFDAFDELKDICGNDIDFSLKDSNLDMWIRFYRIDNLVMLYSSVATNPDLTIDEKQAFMDESINYSHTALKILNDIATNFPNDKDYSLLFVGYIHGHLRYHCYKEINSPEKAAEHSRNATEAFKTFYLRYKELYPGDGYLCNQFAQVYYLDLARHCEHITGIEKISAKRILSTYLQKHQRYVDRQHDTYKKLQKLANELLNSLEIHDR